MRQMNQKCTRGGIINELEVFFPKVDTPPPTISRKRADCCVPCKPDSHFWWFQQKIKINVTIKFQPQWKFQLQITSTTFFGFTYNQYGQKILQVIIN